MLLTSKGGRHLFFRRKTILLVNYLILVTLTLFSRSPWPYNYEKALSALYLLNQWPDFDQTGTVTNKYEGGSIYNENPFIAPSTNALGFYVICQTKNQSVAVIMVHETLIHLTKFNKLQTF